MSILYGVMMTEISSSKTSGKMPGAGQKAPDFSGLDATGSPVSLSDYRGKKLILFFYPKDNTPTCIKESCNLRDDYALLRKNGFEVLGVSADSVVKHRNFTKKFKLPYRLLADVNKDAINAYGVWGERKLFGIVFDGIIRTTFIIDEKGVISHVIRDVESGNHSRQILELNGN